MPFGVVFDACHLPFILMSLMRESPTYKAFEAVLMLSGYFILCVYVAFTLLLARYYRHRDGESCLHISNGQWNVYIGGSKARRRRSGSPRTVNLCCVIRFKVGDLCLKNL